MSVPGLHIAHILSSLGLGGQERVALDLARAQRAAGDTVSIYSLAPPPEGPLGEAFRALGADVHTIGRREGLDTRLPLSLAEALVRARVDLVHTHNPRALLYGATAGALAGVAVVHTKHGANPDRGRRLASRRAVAGLVDAFVAVSEGTAAVARELGEVAPRKLSVIENGIDLGRFHPDPQARAELRAELGIPTNAWVVGTVGRLAPEKDQALLLRAVASMPDDGANETHLLVAGGGPEADALRALVRTLVHPERIHLLGARADVERVLAALDVFALSSRTEGLPLVVPEAMAAGLPVVTTAVGGLPTVVREGETGLLVPPQDAPALRDALLRLRRDRSLSLTIAERANTEARARFSAERMATEYRAVYARAVAARPLRRWQRRVIGTIFGSP